MYVPLWLIVIGVLIYVYLSNKNKKDIDVVKDLLGGWGVSGAYKQNHKDIFNHIIELDERVKKLEESNGN